MIIGIFGNLGDGKTLSAIELLESYGKGYTVYSNIWLSFPYKKLSLQTLYDILYQRIKLDTHTIIFIDEIATLLDSRGSGTSKINKQLSYIFLQSRKLTPDPEGVIVIYTTQFPQLLDIRPWILTMIKIICQAEEFEDKLIIHRKWIFEKTEETIIEEDYIIGNIYFNKYNTKEIVSPEEIL